MSLQDPIADMLTQIRNGQMAKKENVTVPASNKKVAILKVLEEEGYITAFQKISGDKPSLVIHLKYFKAQPVIEMIQRVSRPGLRVYKSKDKLPKVKGGLGIAIVSTAQGVMSDKQASHVGQGGEVLCIVA